ncbi:MAG: hypothetical protein WB791_04885 [Waddliaceae bacterium]
MKLEEFLHVVERPFVVVGTLLQKDREAVVKFLLALQAPVYLEGISGLREEPRLRHLSIRYLPNLWERAAETRYPIDGILRLGGIPTCRLWRDLEGMRGEVPVCSMSHLPFTGLSWGSVVYGSISAALSAFVLSQRVSKAEEWHALDAACFRATEELFREYPCAEPSLFYALSQHIPFGSTVYLGNSSPIREWDLAATVRPRNLTMFASRGLNGIDGQISTFLGLCRPQRQNWGIFGDLTVLYDMAGPWILEQLGDLSAAFVVVNNGGGQIFSRMFSDKTFQNRHSLSFASLALFWRLDYERWEAIPQNGQTGGKAMIELCPDRGATEQFWEKYEALAHTVRITELAK